MKNSALEKAIKYLFVLSALALSCWLVVSISQNGCATLRSISEGGHVGRAFSADLFGDAPQAYGQVQYAPPVHSGYTPSDRRPAYEALSSDRLRKAYRAIEASVFRVTGLPAPSPDAPDQPVDEETVSAGSANGQNGYLLARAYIPSLSSAEIFMVKEAVAADHPEVFWLTSTYVVGENMHDGSYVALCSYYSYDEINERMRDLEKGIADVLRQIPPGLSDFDLEVRVHDILVSEVDYDHAAAEQPDRFSFASTSYGALVNKMAMCGGYSMAAELMLTRVGVQATVIKGTVNGNDGEIVNHMWNLVRIEGKWYHLDVTWDDPTSEDDQGGENDKSGAKKSNYNHLYFNLTDGMIGLTHTVAPGYESLTDQYIKDPNRRILFNFPHPVCNSTEYNYYERKAAKIASLDGTGLNILKQAFLDASSSGTTTIYLLFDDTLEINEINDWLSNYAVNSGIKYINENSDHNAQLASIPNRYNGPLWQRLYRIQLEYK